MLNKEFFRCLLFNFFIAYAVILCRILYACVVVFSYFFGWWYRYASNLDNKRVDLFEGPGEGLAEDNGLLASCKHMAFLITCNFP